MGSVIPGSAAYDDGEDERDWSRRDHRQDALWALEYAREIGGSDRHDPAAVARWQQHAQVHALLALSAVDA